jgi:hypothetical protein
MKDTYVFSALTLIAVYALSLRKRRFEIKENLISISKNMRVHQTERALIAASEALIAAAEQDASGNQDVAATPQNTITTINLPASNPPSPLSGAEILNTPTPRNKGEDIQELTLEDSRVHHMCVFSAYVFTVFSAIAYLYCTSIPTNICLADLFGPEL